MLLFAKSPIQEHLINSDVVKKVDAQFLLPIFDTAIRYYSK